MLNGSGYKLEVDRCRLVSLALVDGGDAFVLMKGASYVLRLFSCFVLSKEHGCPVERLCCPMVVSLFLCSLELCPSCPFHFANVLIHRVLVTCQVIYNATLLLFGSYWSCFPLFDFSGTFACIRPLPEPFNLATTSSPN